MTRTESTTIVAIGLAFGIAVSCVGCDAPLFGAFVFDESGDLDGRWQIAEYGADDDGCEPQPATAPWEQVRIERVDGADLDVLFCPTLDMCRQQTAPTNQIQWNGDSTRGSAFDYDAELVDSNGLDSHCRLTVRHTVLRPGGTDLELTRSFYEMVLPIESDDDCEGELAEEYRPHLPCVRSETLRLVRAQQEE